MKKLIIGIAAFSLLFTATSCSNETRESGDDLKNQVSFRAAIGKQTRASEFSYWANGNTLTVNAYPVNSDVLTNTFTLTYDETLTKWNSATPFNQPGFALRYYSYFPISANITTPAATASSYSFGYTVQTLAEDQEDLIAATETTNSDAVTLPFTHILSQVNFAMTKIPGVKIKITDISVNGVRNKGTYTFGATSIAGLWALDNTTTGTYDYEPRSGTNETDGTTTGTSYMGNGYDGNTYDNALMLMPQGFASQADGTLSFVYSLIPIDSDGTDGTEIIGTVTANLCDFELTTWAQGKRYLYLIDFSAFLAGGPITFTVTLEPWLNATPYLSAQTIYVADAKQISIEAAIAKHSAENTILSDKLTVFPIAVPDDITANVVIENITGFDKDDQIRIEFPNDASTVFLLLDPSLAADWAKTIVGRVVILTKK